MPGRIHAAWRRTGAELPFGDLGADRGTAFEGWYWRLVDPASGRVIVVLCGGMRDWALGALAAHPGGFVSEVIADGPRAVFSGNVHATVAADARVQVELRARRPWPRRALGALGPAHLLPFMPQYWQPLVLDASAHGEAVVGGETVRIDGWRAYHEKNWGPSFAGDWWWGQAHVDEDAGVAFAGGRLGARLAPTAIVAHVGGQLIALSPPAAVRARIGDGTWAVRARSLRHAVRIEAEGAGPPHLLPVPAGERRVEPRSHQHLAGRLALTVTRGRRTLIRAETPLAGLERGFSAPRPGAPPA